MKDRNLIIPSDESEAAAFFASLNGRKGAGQSRDLLVDNGSYYRSGTGGKGNIINPSGINRIHGISSDDMLAVAGGGVEVERLKKAAEGEGAYFPSGSLPFRGMTLAQLVDEGSVSDLRRVYGPVREYIMAVKLVTPGGRRISAGSHAVKDVTGYDLIAFLGGSLGRCGLITEVTVRLLPARRFRRTIIYSCRRADFRETSVEINREGGSVSQKIFFDKAASIICGPDGAAPGLKGDDEGILAVRFEAESEEGIDRMEKRIDRVAERGGLIRRQSGSGEFGPADLCKEIFASDSGYAAVLHISGDQAPRDGLALKGVVWKDLYPERIHYLLPLKPDSALEFDVPPGLNLFRAEILLEGSRKFPLGTGWLNSVLLRGSGRIIAVDILDAVQAPFLLRERLESVNRHSDAGQRYLADTESGIFRLFDPERIVVER